MNSEQYDKLTNEEKNNLRCRLCGNQAGQVMVDGGFREPVCDECYEKGYSMMAIADVLPIKE